MTHAKRGYILFLMFTVLSVCSVLISLYFSQVVVYRQLMHVLITKEKTNRLALSAVSLAQGLITPKEEKEEEKQTTVPAASAKETKLSEDQKLLIQLFDCWNKELVYPLSSKSDGLDAKIFLNVQSEQGKLNLNSLYDFKKKKFLFEGTPKDRKKICSWIFEKIATISKKPTLFPAFEKYLAKRDFDINDVTELLSIKDFADVFEENLFIEFEEISEQKTTDQAPTNGSTKIFLTDLFTVSTEQDTINPWLFSPSWIKILDLKPKQKLTIEEKKKIFSQVQKTANWESDWNKNLKDFYQKEYKDIPQEIKTILTTEFEANIFSLLLKVNIGETNSTIFTI
ncbi:hypothetical protein KBB68_04200, partial [Candidatus Babeliales bacterium]|nr:hypothetical protein [Candidatus Babeliales bacterium]